MATLAALAFVLPVVGAHATGTRTGESFYNTRFITPTTTVGLPISRPHPRRQNRRRHRSRFTGYVVEGRTSTFGYLTGDSEGQTADGGNTARPCIAIRNDLTLDHWFEVTILGHHARLLDCDWGPASFTGRSIDVTGEGDRALGFNPSSFPTGAWGVARELR
ncbi:MAG: hypothetical protein ACRDK4_05065 [Solirubrobacteraceae bacterium]